jgi:predicted P-loop ATPase
LTPTKGNPFFKIYFLVMKANLNHNGENSKFLAKENKDNSLIINDLGTKNLTVPFGESRLNVPVCTYKGVTSKTGLKTTLGTLLAKMQASDPLSIATAESLKTAYQSYKETGNKEPYNEIKNNLDGFVLGDYSSRIDKNCLAYYGLLGMDIDGYNDALEMSWDLETLKKNPYVFAAFPSPSAHGLRILVWTDSTFETHKETYKAVLNYLSDWLHITTDKDRNPHLDPSTSNPCRLWFFTHTTDVYLNLESKVFTPSVFTTHETATNEKAATETDKRPQYNDVVLTETDKITACVEMSNRRNNSTGRNNFVFNTACLCFEHGVSTDAILSHFVSTYAAEDFTQAEIQKTVNSATKRAQFGKFKDGQLLAYLKKDTPSVPPPMVKAAAATPSVSKAKTVNFEREVKDDDTFESDKKAAMNELEEYISERYDLRYNYILNDFEISYIGRNRFCVLNLNDLIRELQSQKIKVSDKSLKVSLLSSFVPHHNPLETYFKSLENKWQLGDKDHITDMANFVETTDQYFFNLHFKKMLVRVVACALGHLAFNKHCFTLFSITQNLGKTTFFRRLTPKPLKPYYKENLDVDKDGRLALCQNLFINLDELKGLSKADINEIKTYFSMDMVKDRKPYGDKPENFKRTASFFGSTNNREFLTDETGNVRWLVFDVKRINHDRGGKNGYMSVDIESMWAQAVYLLMNGFEYELNNDEIAYSEQNNNVNYSQTTYEMELIQEYFEAGTEDDHEFQYTASKIQDEISIGTNRKVSFYQIGRALTKLGYQSERKWDKNKKNTGTFYFLKKREKS